MQLKSLNGSNFDHMTCISVPFQYKYFNNQDTGPGSGPGLVPGPVPGPKFKQDWDQSSGPETTGTGTNL